MRKLLIALLLVAASCVAQTKTGRINVPANAVAFSATPVFDASKGPYITVTLTGNVTSSTLSNAAAGQIIILQVCQDSTGGRAFVWPTNVLNTPTITSVASTCTTVFGPFDGTNWNLAPTSAAVSSLTLNGPGPFSLTMVEGSPGLAPSPLAGSSFIRSSNVSHALEVSLNGAAYVALPSVAGDIGGSAATPTITAVRGRTVNSAAPLNGQVYRWVAANSDWEPQNIVGVGTTLAASNFVLSAGWGNTATVTAVNGIDSSWVATITAQGTGIAAQPTVTTNFNNGVWTGITGPFCQVAMTSGTGNYAFVSNTQSTTSVLSTYQGLPVTGQTYILTGLCLGQ